MLHIDGIHSTPEHEVNPELFPQNSLFYEAGSHLLPAARQSFWKTPISKRGVAGSFRRELLSLPAGFVAVVHGLSQKSVFLFDYLVCCCLIGAPTPTALLCGQPAPGLSRNNEQMSKCHVFITSKVEEKTEPLEPLLLVILLRCNSKYILMETKLQTSQ